MFRDEACLFREEEEEEGLPPPSPLSFHACGEMSLVVRWQSVKCSEPCFVLPCYKMSVLVCTVKNAQRVSRLDR